MDFKTNSGVWGTMFGVPCIVADNFLKLASGEQIKVLLYLLRHSGRTVSAEEISANTGSSREQTEEAILFWQQANVLTPDSAIVPQSIMTPPPAPAAFTQPEQPKTSVQAVSAEQNTPPVITAPPKKQLLRSTEIVGIMKENPDIAELFKITEATLGTLNNSMQNSLIWMYNYLGLKKEVIIILISYCAEIGKPNPSYIEKIALSWAEKDINSLESAQEEVERLTSSHNFTYEIKKLFEMSHNPTTNQQKFINQWQEAGYSSTLIHYAYERTVEQINKLSFEYINKILISWGDSGYKTPEEVKAAEGGYRKKRAEATGSSDGFNADKYKVLINNI